MRLLSSHSPALLLAGLSLCFSLITPGVPLPAGEPSPAGPADPAVYDIERTSDDLRHWAFQPIAPAVPPVPDRDAGWVRNPIDAFVLQKLHEKGLDPSPPADDRT